MSETAVFLSPEAFQVSMRSVLVRAACVAMIGWTAATTAAEQPESLRITPAPELPASLPWDLAALSDPPAFEWIDDAAPVRSLLYAGEPFKGQATRVFAYYATPASIGAEPGAAAASGGPWPGIVLVHGGGGTAFSEWVTLWAKRGYAAIAMDLAGSRPDPAAAKKNTVVRLPDGGPGQDHKDKFDTISTPKIDDDWPYHAVANVIRAHSLLRSLPGVDAGRTAITGISWGGYTTCLVASLDSRFRAAVPVYGCGHLRDNSCWLGDFARIGPEQSTRWAQLYDPASYLPACRVPIFFVNGTNDFAYPLDSFMKSHADVRHASKNVRIQVNMPHGHEEGWAPAEIAAFIDAVLLGTPGQADGPGGGGVSARVPSVRRRHSADRVHHGAGADPEDPHAPWRTARAATNRSRAGPAHRLGRARSGPGRPRRLSSLVRRAARDRHPQPLTGAGRKPPKPRERQTGTRSAQTQEKHHRRGMRGVTANRRRTADTPNLAAQEQSVSRKTVAEVPLTGLPLSLTDWCSSVY